MHKSRTTDTNATIHLKTCGTAAEVTNIGSTKKGALPRAVQALRPVQVRHRAAQVHLQAKKRTRKRKTRKRLAKTKRSQSQSLRIKRSQSPNLKIRKAEERKRNKRRTRRTRVKIKRKKKRNPRSPKKLTKQRLLTNKSRRFSKKRALSKFCAKIPTSC
jgi:hypothetical protein